MAQQRPDFLAIAREAGGRPPQPRQDAPPDFLKIAREIGGRTPTPRPDLLSIAKEIGGVAPQPVPDLLSIAREAGGVTHVPSPAPPPLRGDPQDASLVAQQQVPRTIFGNVPVTHPTYEATLTERLVDADLALRRGVEGLAPIVIGALDVASTAFQLVSHAGVVGPRGSIGEALEKYGGWDPEILVQKRNAYLSSAQQSETVEYQDAEGTLKKIAAAFRYPSVLAQTVLESLPATVMGAMSGGVLFPGAPAIGAAVGEGVVITGSMASQLRQDAKDGKLSLKMVGSSVLAGAWGTAVAAAGGLLAKHLGVADVDTLLASVADNPKAQQGLIETILGMLVSGPMEMTEEIGQTAGEVVLQNYASGRPLSEGMAGQLVLAGLSGFVLGEGAQIGSYAMGRAASEAQEAPEVVDTALVSEVAEIAALDEPEPAGEVILARDEAPVEGSVAAPSPASLPSSPAVEATTEPPSAGDSAVIEAEVSEDTAPTDRAVSDMDARVSGLPPAETPRPAVTNIPEEAADADEERSLIDSTNEKPDELPGRAQAESVVDRETETQPQEEVGRGLALARSWLQDIARGDTQESADEAYQRARVALEGEESEAPILGGADREGAAVRAPRGDAVVSGSQPFADRGRTPQERGRTRQPLREPGTVVAGRSQPSALEPVVSQRATGEEKVIVPEMPLSPREVEQEIRALRQVSDSRVAARRARELLQVLHEAPPSQETAPAVEPRTPPTYQPGEAVEVAPDDVAPAGEVEEAAVAATYIPQRSKESLLNDTWIRLAEAPDDTRRQQLIDPLSPGDRASLLKRASAGPPGTTPAWASLLEPQRTPPTYQQAEAPEAEATEATLATPPTTLATPVPVSKESIAETFGLPVAEEAEMSDEEARDYVEVQQTLVDAIGQDFGEKLRVARGEGEVDMVAELEQSEHFESPEFRRFFGESAVTVEGKPRRVYHGTNRSFDTFSKKLAGKASTHDPGLIGPAFYFTSSGEQAGTIAESAQFRDVQERRADVETGANVMPVYLSMQNPYRIDDMKLPDGRTLTEIYPQGISSFHGRKLQAEIKALGHDGVILSMNGEELQFVVFDESQVKSATGNRGTYDESSNILHQQSQAQPAPIFYSRLVKAVEGVKQDKATGAQWKAMIRKAPTSKDEYLFVSVDDLEDGKKYTKAEVLQYLELNRVNVVDVRLGEQERGGTHYGEYSLPGMDEETYREVFLTYQPRGQQTRKDVYDPAYMGVQKDRSDMSPAGVAGLMREFTYGRGEHRSSMQLTPDTKAKISNWVEWNNRASEKWNDGHSEYDDVSNPVVRIRLNKRETKDGEIVFLEEVQPPSKDNQEKMPPLFLKNWRELAFKWALRYAVDEGAVGVGWTTGAQQADRYDLRKKVDSIEWRLPRPPVRVRHRTVANPEKPWMVERRSGEYYDTAGRFRTEDKANAYAKEIVSRVPGYATHVTVNLKDGDTVWFGVSPEGRAVEASADRLQGEKVEDIVGKEIAKQINESPKGTISEGGLSIGGEGLRKLYDVDFRSVAQKLPVVKKAKGRVGPGSVGEKPAVYDVAMHVGAGAWVVTKDGVGDTRYGLYNNKSEAIGQMRARQAIEGEKANQPIHTLAITPDMAASIKRGQPLFQAHETGFPKGSFGNTGDIVNDTAIGVIRSLRAPDESTFIHEVAHAIRKFLLNSHVPAQLREGVSDADIAAIEEAVGVTDGVWTRDNEEAFARMVERYLYDGQSPSKRLNYTFRKMRQWMQRVYRTLTTSPINVEITPAARAVLDRVFTRAERLDAAAKAPVNTKGFAQDLVDSLTEAEARARERLKERGAAPSGTATMEGEPPTTTPRSAKVPKKSTGKPRLPFDPDQPSPIDTVHPLAFPEMVELARWLQNTPKVVKGFRKVGRAGEFSISGIKIAADLFKKGREIELAATIAHEIGHLTDFLPHKTLKRGNILGRLNSLQGFLRHEFGGMHRNDVTLELKALSRYWRPWNPDTATDSFATYRNSSKELYADAVSVLLNNPGLLQERAPMFYQSFFDGINNKPEVAAAYFGLQELMSGTEAELIERRERNLIAMMESGDQTALEIEQQRRNEAAARRQNLWLRTKIDLIDKNMAVIDKVKAVVKVGGVVNPDADPRYMLEERQYLGGKLKAWVERHVEPAFNTIRDAGLDWNELGLVLFYDRIIAGDRSEVANPNGIAPGDAQQLRDRLRARLGVKDFAIIEREAGKFRAAMKATAEAAYKEGLYSQEMWEQMQENPAYVTFRVVEHMDENVTAKVHKQVGTLKWVQHPADASILKMLATVRAIEYNKVKRGTVDFFQEHYAEDVKEAAYVGWGKTRRPIESRNKNEHLVTFYDKGKVKGVYVDPEVGVSLDNESIGANSSVVEALTLVNSKWFRPAFTTFNLGFQIASNPMRDFGRFWFNIPTMTFGRALKRYRQAMPLAKVRAFGLPKNATKAEREAFELLIQGEEAGIFGITFNDMVLGRTSEDSQVEEIMAKLGTAGFEAKGKSWSGKGEGGIKGQVGNILETIKQLGDYMETLPKAAAIHEYRGEGDVSSIPEDKQSFIRRKVGSPDFLAGGRLKPLSNNISLFSNAITQAARADIEVASQPGTRSGFWWKMGKFAFVPKMLQLGAMYGATMALKAGFEEDEEDDGPLDFLEDSAMRQLRNLQNIMRSATEYDRTQYLVIPIYWDEENQQAHYLRVFQTDSARFLGGIFWKMISASTGNKSVMQSVGQVFDFTGGHVPSLAPIFETVATTAVMVGGGNPYDTFRGRNVLTDDEQRERGWAAWKKFIGWEFQQLGGGVVWKFYPGEQRPREKTTGQKIIEFPFISNIMGRLYRITNYGRIEEYRNVQRREEGREARTRRVKRGLVTDAIEAYRELAPPQRTESRRRRIAKDIVREAYPDLAPADRGTRITAIAKEIHGGTVRGRQDPLLDVVMGGSSNATKATIIMEADMTESARRAWVQRRHAEGVLSDNLRQLVIERSRRDRRRQPTYRESVRP